MQIHPFRAVTYNREKISDLSKVTTQPYDKIDAAKQQAYYDADPHNYVRVILGKKEEGDSDENNVYTRARDTVAQWFAEGVLVRDAQPALWVYAVDYSTPDGATHRRSGVVALADLEEYGEGSIKPHEKTLAGPKADRLNLIRQLRGHYEQIFFLYDDPAKASDAIFAAIAEGEPAFEATDEDGNVHRMWPIYDAEQIAAVQASVGGGVTIIADGHHRYETALNYRREMADVPCEGPETPGRVLAIFVNMADEGLVILPTHRTVTGLTDEQWDKFFERLQPTFEVSDISAKADDPAALLEPLKMMGARGRRGCVVVRRGEAPKLVALPGDADPTSLLPDDPRSDHYKRLDVTVLHKGILEPHLGIDDEVLKAGQTVAYWRDPADALAAVERGDAQAAFLINPTSMDETREVSLAGDTMPQKSTDFYPKVLSGLIASRFNLPDAPGA